MTKSSSFRLRVAIDGNEANVLQRVGSNMYAYEILVALEKITQKTPVEVTVLLAQAAQADLPPARPGWRYVVVKPSWLWTQLAAPIYLFSRRHLFDVFYTPGHYAPRLCPVPYVSSVMDLAFLRYPEQFKTKDLLQLRNWTQYSVQGAQKIIAISKFTKQDIQELYHEERHDIVVAYPALHSHRQILSKSEVTQIIQKLGITEPYILYVGTLQPRKNILRLISAFEEVQRLLKEPKSIKNLNTKYELKLPKELKKVQLVLAGKLGWLTDEILEHINTSPFKEDIVLTGYIDERTKAALYQGASISTLVGLYEGFGIPPLESLSYGTIPVVSETTSLPEVVGESGILVNPERESSIAHGLLTGLLLTARQRATLRRQGRKQLQQFSWIESAQIILNTLRLVGQRS